MFFFIQVLFSIFATQILESKVTVTSVGGPKGGDVRYHRVVGMGGWRLGHDLREPTVDGRNPAPPTMMIIPLFIGF